MVITRTDQNRMLEHVRAAFPCEGCGVLATDGDRVVGVYPLPNAACSPVRYAISSQDQLKVQLQIWDDGHELGAIFHSHTRTPARPSPTDIQEARSPDAVYVIISLAGREPDVRAYRIVQDTVSDEPWHVVD